MSINTVIITGNLTRDPELRSTATSSVLSFSVAVNDRVKEGGEWKDRPNYIDCVAFGNRAESLSQYLAKGTKVTVAGKLHWSQWENRETGKKQSKVEVWADNVEFAKAQKNDAQVYDEDVPF